MPKPYTIRHKRVKSEEERNRTKNLIRKLAKSPNQWLKVREYLNLTPDSFSPEALHLTIGSERRRARITSLEDPRRRLVRVSDLGLGPEVSADILKLVEAMVLGQVEVLDDSEGVPEEARRRWLEEEEACDVLARKGRLGRLKEAAKQDKRGVTVFMPESHDDPKCRHLFVILHIYGISDQVLHARIPSAEETGEPPVWSGAQRLLFDGLQLAWRTLRPRLMEMEEEEARLASVIVKDRLRAMGFVDVGAAASPRLSQADRLALLKRLNADAAAAQQLLDAQEAPEAPFLRRIEHYGFLRPDFLKDEGKLFDWESPTRSLLPSERSWGAAFHLRLGDAVAEIPYSEERGSYYLRPCDMRGWFHSDGDGEPMDELERRLVGCVVNTAVQFLSSQRDPPLFWNDDGDYESVRLDVARRRLEILKRAAVQEDDEAYSGLWGDAEGMWVEVVGRALQVRLTLAPSEEGEVFHFSMAGARQWVSTTSVSLRKGEINEGLEEMRRAPVDPKEDALAPQPVTAEERRLAGELLKRVMRKKGILFCEHQGFR